MALLAPLILFGMKFAAYTWWISFGLARLEPAESPGAARRSAAFWAGVRLVLGLAVGSAVLWLFSLAPHEARPNRIGIPEMFGSPLVTYILVYAPLRLAQWMLLARLMAGRGRRLRRRMLWLSGATAISFVTDAAGLLAAITAIGGIC